jgi:large subunit ribosomal protein L31
MKKDIHPKVNTKATVKCACGNTFVTISTVDEIKIEICNLCHPFFTGQQKFVDTEGRIDKFEKRRKRAEAMKVKATKAKKVAKPTPVTENVAGKSVKEILAGFKQKSEPQE